MLLYSVLHRSSSLVDVNFTAFTGNGVNKPSLKEIFAPVGKTLCLFKLNVDFLQAVKVTKSSHHLSHDQASKKHGSIPRLTSG